MNALMTLFILVWLAALIITISFLVIHLHRESESLKFVLVTLFLSCIPIMNIGVAIAMLTTMPWSIFEIITEKYNLNRQITFRKRE